MALFSIINQEENLESLKNTISNKKIANSYLFYGAEGSGMEAMAMEYAAMLNCLEGGLDACGECLSCKKISNLEYSNLDLVYPVKRKGSRDDKDPFSSYSEKQMKEVQDEIGKKAQNPYHKIQLPKANSIPISFIRKIQKNIHLSSNSKGWKVILFFEVHKMTVPAANAFLKILEEPPEQSVFILTTSQISEILPTIKSRCQTLFFPPLKNEDIMNRLQHKKIPPEELNLIVNLAGGDYSEALKLCDQGIAEIKNKTLEILRSIARWDKKAIYNYVEELTGLYKKNNTVFNQLIRSIGFWFRDAAYVKSGAEEDSLIHSDQYEEISNFVDNYSDFNPGNVNVVLEKCIAMLESNVYINVVLLETFFKIKKFAFKK